MLRKVNSQQDLRNFEAMTQDALSEDETTDLDFEN